MSYKLYILSMADCASACTFAGEFATELAAIAAAKDIIDQSLEHEHNHINDPDDADELIWRWVDFGEFPVISPPPESDFYPSEYVREQSRILCEYTEDEVAPDPEEEAEAARLQVLSLICALRDSYNYGAIVPVLADMEKLRHAMQTARQQWERGEMEEEEYALESWGALNAADQTKIIAMARVLWGDLVAKAFPAVRTEDPETREISDLSDEEFEWLLDFARFS